MTPIYITSYNRLTYLRQMVDYLLQVPDVDITVIDNVSTYPPLLEWYTTCPVKVIRLQRSVGPRAAFSGCVAIPLESRFIQTDPDLDLTGIPKDFLQLLHRGLDENPDICKVGFSLELEDLPRDGIVAGAAREVEAGYWTNRRGDFYDAMIDTTFALYRSGRPCVYGPGLRTDRPYTARHLPWYNTLENITEEDSYYIDHIDPSWAGNLFYSIRQRDEIARDKTGTCAT